LAPGIETEADTMRRTTSLTSFALALLSICGSTTGAAAEPVQQWAICYVRGAPYEPAVRTDRGSHMPIYVSGAVATVPPQDFRDVAAAFAQFIAKTKPFPPGMTASAQCWEGRSAAEVLKEIKHAGTAVAPGDAFGLDCSPGECVMTDWNSLPPPPAGIVTEPAPAAKPCGAYGWKDPIKNCGSDATPAPVSKPVAAAPVAPVRVAPTQPTATVRAVVPVHQAKPTIAPVPQTPYAYCWGGSAGQTQVAYFGAPFEAPARSVPVWSAAYKKILHAKYNFGGVIHCGTLKSLAAAQERMQKEKDQMRAHWKVVETGWKYQ
jgi:hypothetical protein